MNKIQQLARKVNINRVTDFRDALAQYGVSSGTAQDIWTNGITTRKHYAAIIALERVLLTPAIQFLDDPESLIPRQMEKA